MLQRQPHAIPSFFSSRLRPRRNRRFGLEAIGKHHQHHSPLEALEPRTLLATLPGSLFEIDGNLLANTAGNKDWANVGITCPAATPGGTSTCGLDPSKIETPSLIDNSFGQGTKEDTTNPTVVTGSIPPNKDDFSRFYTTNEKVTVNGSSHTVVYVAWERTNSLGSAHMDFEFNHQPQPAFNPGTVNLNRTKGDVLIDYDFGGSGGVVLSLHRWLTGPSDFSFQNGNPSHDCQANNVFPCWSNSALTPLNGGDAIASVNNTAATNFVADPAGGDAAPTVKDPIAPNAPRDIPGNEFGEAAIDFTTAGILGNLSCEGFGSATLKSRSSGSSFTSEIKDFVSPIPVNVGTTCDASIAIHPSAANEVGVPHTFTITATATQDGAVGTPTFAITPSVTPTPAFPNPPDGSITNTCNAPVVVGPNASGITTATCTVTVTSTVARTFVANATAVVGLPGASSTVTRTTGDGINGDSDPATKVYVDGNITITPSATNEVGHSHTFTVTVKADKGDGNGLQPVSGVNPTVTISPLPATVSVTDNCAGGTGTGANGQCTVVINSTAAGTFVATASATFSVSTAQGSVSLTRDTDPATSTPAGPGGSGPATKTFVDASIALSPLTATNLVRAPHTVTATVKQDDGLASGGDGVNGFGPAPDGTLVCFYVANNLTDVSFNDASLPADCNGDGNPNNDTTRTTSGGTASITFTSTTPGTVTIYATTTFNVGGVSLTRDSDSTTAVPHGPNGTDEATKIFFGVPDVHITKDAVLNGQSINGQTIPAGSSYSYVLTVHNDGNALATGVAVTDDLDDRLAIGTITSTAGSCAVSAVNLVTCSLGDVDAGGSVTITIPVTTPTVPSDATPVAPNTCIFTLNSAHVSATNEAGTPVFHLIDSDPNNDNVPDNGDNDSNIVNVTTTQSFQTILFDPDGTGPAAPISISVLDQSPGNSLAINSIPGVNTQAGVDFRVLFQSTMSALLDKDSNVVSAAGLGSSFQLLTVANFLEHGNAPAAGFALFTSPTSNAGPNSFQLIYHPIGTAINNRTGAGFPFSAANNDQVILTGTLSQIFGSASTNGTTSNKLDKFQGAPGGATNPPTVNFAGSTGFIVNITTLNPAFFPDPTTVLTSLNVLSLNSTPFLTVGANSGAFFEGTSRNIGAVNGSSGPDIEFQTDGSTGLNAVCVPLNENGTPHTNAAPATLSAVAAPSTSGATTTSSVIAGPTAGSDGASLASGTILAQVPKPSPIAVLVGPNSSAATSWIPIAGDAVDHVLTASSLADVLLDGLVPRLSARRSRRS